MPSVPPPDTKAKSASHPLARLKAHCEAGTFHKLRRLNVLAAAAMLAFLTYVDNQTNEAWPSAETIAEDLGEKNVGRVRKALAALESIGLLRTVEEGGGRRRSTVRELTVPKTRTASVPVSGTQNGDIKRTGNRDAPAKKGGQNRTKTGTASVPRTTKNSSKNYSKKNYAAAAAAASSFSKEGEEDEAHDTLLNYGVQEPTRSKLLRDFPGLTAGIIDSIAMEITGDWGPGLLVERIRSDAPDMIAAAEHERQRAAAEQAQHDADMRRVGKELDAIVANAIKSYTKHPKRYRDSLPDHALASRRVESVIRPFQAKWETIDERAIRVLAHEQFAEEQRIEAERIERARVAEEERSEREREAREEAAEMERRDEVRKHEERERAKKAAAELDRQREADSADRARKNAVVDAERKAKAKADQQAAEDLRRQEESELTAFRASFTDQQWAEQLGAIAAKWPPHAPLLRKLATLEQIKEVHGIIQAGQIERIA